MEVIEVNGPCDQWHHCQESNEWNKDEKYQLVKGRQNILMSGKAI